MKVQRLMQHRMLAGFLVGLALLASFHPSWHRAELQVLNLFERAMPDRVLNGTTSVVAIDEVSIEQLGPWPWPRDRLAHLIETLDQAGATVIGVLLPLRDAQPLPDEFAFAATDDQQLISQRRAELDPDKKLASAIINADKVVLSTGLLPGAAFENSQGIFEIQHAQHGWARYGLMRFLVGPPHRTTSFEPAALPLFSASSSANAWQPRIEHDIARLSESLAVTDGRVTAGAPSFLLELLRESQGEALSRANIEGGVWLGDRFVATDGRLHIYPYPISQDSKDQVMQYSAVDVLQGSFDSQAFAGKVVLLGMTANVAQTGLLGPVGRSWSTAHWYAYLHDSVLQDRLLHVPAWIYGAQRLLLLLIGLGLIFLPVILRRPVMLAGSLALAFVLCNVSLVLLLTHALWVPLAMPALFLIFGHALLISRERIMQILDDLRGAAEQAYRDLAVNLQGQGQLDRAMEYLMRIRLGVSVLDPLYGLAMDFERRRQFAKALQVYDHMMVFDGEFRDVSARREQLVAMPDVFPAARNSSATISTATVVLDAASIARPVIGRYEIEREIGHGAMGTVYLGKDPKIGRTVAIKTLSLAMEFEEDQLAEVMRRFYQEAETAGQLNHPNIVTIYDVGEEHDLAYIAMDYLQGDSLKPYVSKDHLLPVIETLNLGRQIAEALDYAHQHNIVHRDIKPENMMYHRETGVLKITDFGIAYLTDNSKTRTGTVLGSPYYMSPEQISGKRVDGRSDLYSLGVTLFHMLTGELPFSGDSLATLMYKITHEKPPSVRKIRKELPNCTVRIINKALEKDLDRRFATGREMADALKRCLAKLEGDVGGRGGK